MSQPRWLLREEIDFIHWELVEEHGGLHGIRDEAAIESALDRPRHTWSCDEQADLPVLAAALGYGLVTNHGYVDGNKRVAFFAVVLFLRRNGLLLAADQGDVVRVIRDLASGEMGEEDFSSWIRNHVRPR